MLCSRTSIHLPLEKQACPPALLPYKTNRQVARFAHPLTHITCLNYLTLAALASPSIRETFELVAGKSAHAMESPGRLAGTALSRLGAQFWLRS